MSGKEIRVAGFLLDLLKDQINDEEHNSDYLAALNDKLHQQELKLENQQETLNNHLNTEERLRRHISEKRKNFCDYWVNFLTIEQQMLDEITSVIRSERDSTSITPEFSTDHPGGNQQRQVEAQQHVASQMLTTESGYYQPSSEPRPFLQNNNISNVASELSRLNNLVAYRQRLESEINVQQHTQHESDMILRSNKDLLRKQRQQLHILQREIMYSTDSEDST